VSKNGEQEERKGALIKIQTKKTFPERKGDRRDREGECGGALGTRSMEGRKNGKRT